MTASEVETVSLFDPDEPPKPRKRQPKPRPAASDEPSWDDWPWMKETKR